jgi:hypothetical protein
MRGRHVLDEQILDRCDFCARGLKIRRNQDLAFQQWTDRGFVSCRVNIPMSTCDCCNAKSWDDAAEAVIDEAVREAYDRLSCDAAPDGLIAVERPHHSAQAGSSARGAVTNGSGTMHHSSARRAAAKPAR